MRLNLLQGRALAVWRVRRGEEAVTGNGAWLAAVVVVIEQQTGQQRSD
jgi:hypothetical protein